MNIKEYDDHVTIKDIVKSIKMVPKTLVLIKNVDKKSFFIIILLSLLMGLRLLLHYSVRKTCLMQSGSKIFVLSYPH